METKLNASLGEGIHISIEMEIAMKWTDIVNK